MIKILLHYPRWNNRWIPYIEKELGFYDLTITHTQDGTELAELSEKADILFSMWANEAVVFWTNYFADKKIVAYLRRFEIWEDALIKNIKWDALNAIVFVSNYYKQALNKFRDIDLPNNIQFVIPNGVDINDFPLRLQPARTGKIAMVCSIKNVKNIPLACQVLMSLPDKYKIHHIGLPFSSQIIGQIMSYIENLGLMPRFIFEDPIPSEQVSAWLQDKECILSTSLNEGNPNNIIEAMAMGIKPIIHNWPGAFHQFPRNLVFSTIDEARNLILDNDYQPGEYRSWIEKYYSLDNFKKLHEVINACQT